MNPCALTDRLDAFLDGDLAPREAALFEAHLAGCADCADEVTLARRLHAGLRALPAEPCPDEVFEAALARIAALERRPAAVRDRPAVPASARRVPRWRAFGVGAALLALLALTVLLARTAAEAPEAPAIAAEEPAAPPEPPAPAPVEVAPEVQTADAQAVPEPPPAPAPRRARRAAPAVAEPLGDPQVAHAAPDSSALSPEAVAARDGALLALALVADAQREARQVIRTDVREELGAVSDALALAFPD